MDLQNQSMNLVLSTDAKPRLKWTPDLHQRFVDAVNQLGGAEKATPKSLTRVMGVSGLTLYHLKSHLQKFRLGKSQVSDTKSDNKQDYREIQSSNVHCSRETSVGAENQITEGLQIAQALQMQKEVQRKLHEQIEVQRHLQLRIEAQGKYLQSVLNKAQVALAAYSPSAAGLDIAKAEISQLVSSFNNVCPSSPISELTETRMLGLNDEQRKKYRGTMCSMESSLTSSESSGWKEEKQPMKELGNPQKSNDTSVELPLMPIHPENKSLNGDTRNEADGRKRSEEWDADDGYVEKPLGKRRGNKLRRVELSHMFDLNNQYQSDSDSSSKEIDLNLV